MISLDKNLLEKFKVEVEKIDKFEVFKRSFLYVLIIYKDSVFFS